LPTDKPFEPDLLDQEAHVRRAVEEIERGEDDEPARVAEKPAVW